LASSRFSVFITFRIELRVPCGQLVVRHEPAQRRPAGYRDAWAKHLEVHSQNKDIHVVVREAFKSVRRQLQDYGGVSADG